MKQDQFKRNMDLAKALRNDCIVYIQMVGLGIMGELIRLQFHQRILDKLEGGDIKAIDYLLHNLETSIGLKLPVYDDPENVGYSEAIAKKFGTKLYHKLLPILRGIVDDPT